MVPSKRFASRSFGSLLRTASQVSFAPSKALSLNCACPIARRPTVPHSKSFCTSLASSLRSPRRWSAASRSTSSRVEWKDVPVDKRSAQALRSPRLKDSYENYSRAFDEDLNHYYSGLNALAMLTIMVELGAALPKVWGEPFESDEKAALELASYKEQAQKLAAAVDLSLRATRNRLKRDDKTDVWAEISYADLLCNHLEEAAESCCRISRRNQRRCRFRL